VIECPTCGRSHRTEKAVDLCAARAAKRAEREEKREADRIRRVENWKKKPPQDYIRERLSAGTAWVNIIAGLNREYPPPYPWSRGWTLIEAVAWDCERLNWPDRAAGEYIVWPEDRITTAQLERSTHGFDT
jgi:hypothetical protein